MICPYCLKEIHFQHLTPPWNLSRPNQAANHTFLGGFCPACQNLIVVYYNTLGTFTNGVASDEGYRKSTVFPKNRTLRPISSEIPSEYAQEFDEARLVLDVSSKSSAALGRACFKKPCTNVSA